jgi:hypothetical protein
MQVGIRGGTQTRITPNSKTIITSKLEAILTLHISDTPIKMDRLLSTSVNKNNTNYENEES